MKFNKISFKDLPTISQYLLINNYSVCDFSLGCLYFWSDYFDYKYCIENDFLFISGNDTQDSSLTTFAVPLGQGNVCDAIRMLIEYLRKNGKDRLVLNAVPKEVAEIISMNFASEITNLPEWSDYVYDAEKLATLSGHSYNKKRNLVHQFERTYSYTYDKLTNANIRKIIDRYEHLCRNDKSEYGIYEEAYTVKLLKEMARNHSVEFEGGVLLVDEIPAAFTIGSVVNDMLFVHVEKADIAYKGAYQMINMLFANDMFENKKIKYINREEDLGDPNLRQTKLSYNPIKLVEKFRIEIDI